MAGKREDYISWDTYFMLVALISTERSKDPSTQVGAVIVKNNRILSVGYNGTPKGMSDDDMPWDSLGEQTGDVMQIKNSFVVHAEANAFNNLPLGTDLNGAIMYVTFSPCHLCAQRIASSGIEKVIYLEKYRKEIEFVLSKTILDYAGISLEQMENLDLLKQGLQAVSTKLDCLKTPKLVRKIEYKK